MSCERLGPWLDAYYDGELRGLRQWRVQRHLAGCAGCRQRLAGMEPLRAWVREAVGPASTPDVWRELEQRLPVRPSGPAVSHQRRAPRAAFAMPALGVAAAAALFGILLLGGPADWSRLFGTTPQTVVRSLNTHGRPVMVLDGPTDATIIWLMDDDRGQPVEESTSVWI